MTEARTQVKELLEDGWEVYMYDFEHHPTSTTNRSRLMTAVLCDERPLTESVREMRDGLHQASAGF